MRTTLQRWGNSIGIRIPKAMIESLGAGVGTEVLVELSEDRTKITLKPSKDRRPIRGRHRIEDLIAASSPDAFKGEYGWGDPQGKEVW
ncbi:MAG TPA: AbrB/MazE/SpoVT family DNA-binding domain-containing protein [Candidatus Paceibacterota bacterium]|nr:AbrB/MazE/SpoVT family DNA-binding domain-containing protein [Verrucomicrobiota bacterium]HRY48536.1 AbrB/MazE/SpoVT family DNA-binding domain-containing protein [Candidatus Paceibacterota bacterium]HRZ99271.1 AbrB/MazE/SpoVT family DNA-binding domain-containing protein [Candidatus Paceibacterota bacterium]